MTGIARRAICNPLLLPRASIYAGVGEAVDAVAGHHHRHHRHHHRRHPHRCQQQRSVASMHGFYALDGFNAASPSSRLFAGLGERRFSHSETTTTDEPHRPSLEKKRSKTSSDPTARRPTQKCDPYGLQGASLPRDQCLDLLATLEDGWTLLPSENDAVETTADDDGGADDDAAAPTVLNGGAPTFLRMRCHHATMSEASRFVSRISMVATNVDHYPHLSVERILADDANDDVLGEDNNDRRPAAIDDNDDEATASGRKKRKRKARGWVFRSTIRCSTYRPPTRRNDGESTSGVHDDKGLTFHDFHLAMNVDVEMSREEIRRLLRRSDPED